MFGHGKQIPAERLEMLRSLPIFANVSDDELRTFDSQLEETTVAAGQTIIVEGKTGREAFIILEGEAEVIKNGAVVADVRHGDLLGEMALLDDVTRTASVRAVTPLRILVMNPLQFASLFREPHVAQWVEEQIARRQGNPKTAESTPQS